MICEINIIPPPKTTCVFTAGLWNLGWSRWGLGGGSAGTVPAKKRFLSELQAKLTKMQPALIRPPPWHMLGASLRSRGLRQNHRPEVDFLGLLLGVLVCQVPIHFADHHPAVLV